MTAPSTHEPAGPPDLSGAGGLVRLRLDVAYDGTAFHGWARQPGLRTVQAELEAALRAVLRVPADVPVRVAVAGRTDAGVHATGQVCHCDVPAYSWAAAASSTRAPLAAASHSEFAGGGRQEAPPSGESVEGSRPAGAYGGPRPAARPAEAEFAGSGLHEAQSASESGRGGRAVGVRRRLNGLLPLDLRVRCVGIAPDGFDARWSAAWRRYEYLVADDAVGQDPRSRRHVLWHPRSLDVEAMDAAARPFAGEHDFAALCRARPDASSVRTIHEIGWRPLAPSPGAVTGGGPEAAPPPPDGAGSHGGGLLAFTIRADAFCHSMVRSLVGAFLAVGDGRWPVERPAALLAAGERIPSIPTAPALGLTLVEVGYPPDSDLAAQAQRARRWRGA